MENNPDGHLLKVLVCLFFCLKSNQVIILWQVFKRNKKDKKQFFASIIDFTWILSTPLYFLQTSFVIFSSYGFQMKQISILEIYCVTTSDKTATFTSLTLPKMILGFEIQKSNFRIRIHILEIPCVPIFRQSGQMWPFFQNLPKNWFLTWKKGERFNLNHSLGFLSYGI